VLDVGTHLSIDPDRIYTAGLSGGARVATQLALSGMSKGVIACSAGFPTSDNIPNRVPFPFFGTAGTEDFNYAELKRLDNELDDRGAAHRIVIFEGGHEWASAALLTDAVEWLELQGMRTGAWSRDDALIQAALKSRVAAVESMTGGETWVEMKLIAADFKGLVDTGEYERRAKELAASRVVKDWRKAERLLAIREDDLVAKLAELGRGVSESKIRRTAEDLRRKAEAPDDSAERRMARRAIGSVAISVRENVRTLFDQQSYGEASSLLALFAALRPGQARTYYDLARARAFARETKSALDALAQAAGAGFSDATRVEAEPAFARLKNEPAFQAALAAIRANPASSVPPSPAHP